MDKKYIPSKEKIAEELSKAKSLDDFFGKDGVVAKLVAKGMEAMMEEELKRSLGYDRYERKPESDNARNGKYTRKLKTSVGEIPIEIPRDRLNEYEAEVIKAYQTKPSEFENRIVSMYAHGMSTADIKDHLYETYGTSISEDLISGIRDKILPLAKEWQSRPLMSIYVLVYLDCIHVKIRHEGKVDTRAVYIVLGVDLEGRKDILGMYVTSASEGAQYWLSVVTDLKNRGIEDIFIACMDGLKGFSDAVKAIFPETVIQRCVVHQIRTSLKYVAWKDRKAFVADLKSVYKAVSEEAALDAFACLKDTWGEKYAIAIKSWESNWDELSAMYHYPPEIRKLMYTTNIIESFNSQLRKTSRNKKVFPTQDSVIKIFYLTAQNVIKKWDKVTAHWPEVLNQLVILFEGRVIL